MGTSSIDAVVRLRRAGSPDPSATLPATSYYLEKLCSSKATKQHARVDTVVASQEKS